MQRRSRCLRGRGRDRAALFLRLAIAGYAVLVICFRHLGSFPPDGSHAGPPAVALWVATATLTLLPLVYAFRLTWRSLFGASLMLASFVTFEVIAVHGWDLCWNDVGEPPAYWPAHIAVRLALLIALWGATLVFSRVDATRASEARATPDWRIVTALFLAFVLPELEAFRVTVLFYDDWAARMLPSWILLGVGALGTALAAGILRENGLALACPSRPRGRGRAATLALIVVLLTVLWSVLHHAWEGSTWMPRGFDPTWPGFELFLMVALVGPLIEEWTWRGVLWAALERRLGTWTAVAVTSTAFGLIHLPGGPVTAMPMQLVSGLLWGWLRARSGRLWPCVVAHALSNAVLIFLVPTS